MLFWHGQRPQLGVCGPWCCLDHSILQGGSLEYLKQAWGVSWVPDQLPRGGEGVAGLSLAGSGWVAVRKRAPGNSWEQGGMLAGYRSVGTRG